MLALATLSACGSAPTEDSIWPPADFELTVEELRMESEELRVSLRFRALADGLVVFATSGTSLVDAESRTALPVFDRLAVYQLVPTSIRALARRIDRCGIAGLDRTQGERGGSFSSSLVLTWQCFGRRHVITANGRPSGAMAEILAIVAAHLPDGEKFALPGVAERPVVSVLRGVPAPQTDAIGALAVHQTLLEQKPEDRTLVVDALALACHLGQRSLADALLERWLLLTADERRQQAVFPEGEAQLTPALLRRFLPPS